MTKYALYIETYPFYPEYMEPDCSYTHHEICFDTEEEALEVLDSIDFRRIWIENFIREPEVFIHIGIGGTVQSCEIDSETITFSEYDLGHYENERMEALKKLARNL